MNMGDKLIVPGSSPKLRASERRCHADCARD